MFYNMNLGKILTLILWIFLGTNYLVNFSVWANYFGLMLLVIHLMEYLIFFKKIRLSGDTIIKSFIQTLIFGVLYIGSIKNEESA